MYKYLIGVDEAGRGPLAGPVAVGVAVVSKDFDWKLLPGVTDSKKLTVKKREEIFELAKQLKKAGKLDYAVSMVGPSVIDRKGIVTAVNRGIQRSLKKIENTPIDWSNKEVKVLLDGGLRAPERFIHQETIIQGDSKEKVIGLASIMAKVTRDRYMVRKSREAIFAPYNFHVHKGYGTKNHRKNIEIYGFSKLHRKSYCKNIELL